jgi:hypothetical protein
MSDQQSVSFDFLTEREADRMSAVMAELGGVQWAHGILSGVERDGGLIGKNMVRFFELRFGHAVHQTGIGVEYEISGEGVSTLDFGFTSKGQRWKVEMMRLLETKAAKEATTTGVDQDGIQFKRRLLSSSNTDQRQSTEGETLAAIQHICQKCEEKGKPHKFEKPESLPRHNRRHANLQGWRRHT